ncbi:hypothetical protein TW85_21250 [Marinomonas sp. S3726]|uniref:DUF1499 domain-containing protein n=1 Tax=Marinomonas sp. S3726 TaxID=579484 RepID=UPI0005FA535A|nr:DUF1499 domain-containing protein [Marinomonas sp. S3726]KJZ09809.1 hypothetical protein TW85_21250 [Marinomonas sp. S3726]
MQRFIPITLYGLIILAGSMAFVSIAGVRVGLLEPVVGFILIKKTVLAAIFLFFFSIFAYWKCQEACNKEKRCFIAACILFSGLYSGAWLSFYVPKMNLPLINDITTDTKTPPAFITMSSFRHAGDNEISYSKEFAAIQEKAYPQVQPVITDESSSLVFRKVVDLVRQQGWQVVSLYPTAGVIEATATTPVFWFMDDVVVRVRSVDGKTRVDMRSCSRIGTHDFGKNAHRIEDFMSELRLSLETLDES